MRTHKLIIAGLMANALAACSSPPKLSEPDGDWISFETPHTAVTGITSSVPAPASTPYVQPSPPLFTSASRPPVLTSLVNGDGKNVPLYMAARTIVPASESVKLSPDVAQNFRTAVSWTGNDQWPFVLQKMLRADGLEAVIDTQRHEVTIQYGQKAAAPAKVVVSKPAAVKSPAAAAAPASESKPAGGMLKTPVTPVITQGSSAATASKPLHPAISPSPVPVLPALKTWTMEKGTTLKAGFAAWVAKETCQPGNGKWLVRWDTDTDYHIDYPLSFSSASFEDATSQLFNLYRRAQAPLYVSGYRNQCLIVISDRK